MIPDQSRGIPCYHHFFIGRNYEYFDSALGFAYFDFFTVRSGSVTIKININAQIIHSGQDAFAHADIVFADARRKHDSVHAVHCRGIGTDVFFDLICKH